MNQDRWTAVTCFVIAIFIVLAIPSQTSDRPLPGARGFDILDGAFFPEIAVTLFIIASIWLFIEARPGRLIAAAAKRADAEAASGSTTDNPALASEDQPPGITVHDLLWSLGLSGGMLVYVQFLDVFGYLACSIVGVTLLALICGQRSLVGLVVGGVVFPSAIFYLFTKLFMVPLPRGFF